KQHVRALLEITIRRTSFDRRAATSRKNLLDRLVKRLAEGMCRIDTKNLHLLRIERQLLEREHELAILRMAFHVGVELGGEEIALDHVAFELGHVDAVGRKTAERLVERGRDVAHTEQKRRDARSAARR